MSALPLLASHYSGVIMGVMTSQITSVSFVYSTVCSGKDQRQHQRSASLAFVRVIHRWPVNSPHKKPVTRKIFPFNDVIMHRDRKMHTGQVSQGAWMSNSIPENTVGYNYQSLSYIYPWYRLWQATPSHMIKWGRSIVISRDGKLSIPASL